MINLDKLFRKLLRCFCHLQYRSIFNFLLPNIKLTMKWKDSLGWMYAQNGIFLIFHSFMQPTSCGRWNVPDFVWQINVAIHGKIYSDRPQKADVVCMQQNVEMWQCKNVEMCNKLFFLHWTLGVLPQTYSNIYTLHYTVAI